jgi:hypothetical protein
VTRCKPPNALQLNVQLHMIVAVAVVGPTVSGLIGCVISCDHCDQHKQQPARLLLDT